MEFVTYALQPHCRTLDCGVKVQLAGRSVVLRTTHPVLVRLTPFKLTVHLWSMQLLQLAGQLTSSSLHWALV